MSEQTRKPWLFRFIKGTIRFFYPKLEVVGYENLPDSPCAIIGNHAQINGPIACELFLPDSCCIWCAGEMMDIKEVPQYAYTDFWSQKPKFTRPFFKVLSYLIAPLCTVVFNNARTIAVYKDNRILGTLKETVSKLKNGYNVVIFPEHDKKHNNIVYDFQEGFVDVARLHYKRTGKVLSFVPLYIAPKLKKMIFGKPIAFSPDSPISEERRRICDILMAEITEIACSLPEHTVIPYRNIPKRLYPKNTRTEAKK